MQCWLRCLISLYGLQKENQAAAFGTEFVAILVEAVAQATSVAGSPCSLSSQQKGNGRVTIRAIPESSTNGRSSTLKTSPSALCRCRCLWMITGRSITLKCSQGSLVMTPSATGKGCSRVLIGALRCWEKNEAPV